MTHFNRVCAVFVVLGSGVLTAGCERPPMEAEQYGYRGVAMEAISNPRLVAETALANQVPAPQPEAVITGQKASDIYQNVQLLGDLDVGEFTRLMVAITQWISPKEGCNYCHEAGNLASDAVYTKVVARRMIQMTRHINGEWQNHVRETGVTCYTCHRGQAIPKHIWFTDPAPPQAGGVSASRNGQNLPSESVGDASLPYDPFTPFLSQAQEIRVLGGTALPTDNTQDIKQAEWTYGLMMHFSNSLGVNCTFCHNSRAFLAWDRPQRVSAWYGIRMAREINNEYVDSLRAVFPPHRLGPRGDVAKVNCSTCHQGVNKPLYGVSMVKDYPSLGGDGAEQQQAQQTEQIRKIADQVEQVWQAAQPSDKWLN
jgi:photosynthetic reaction center cytochrome c subunit